MSLPELPQQLPLQVVPYGGSWGNKKCNSLFYKKREAIWNSKYKKFAKKFPNSLPVEENLENIQEINELPNSLPPGENLENISLENLSWRKIKNQFLYTPEIILEFINWIVFLR